jgi:hypothetical protein
MPCSCQPWAGLQHDRIVVKYLRVSYREAGRGKAQKQGIPLSGNSIMRGEWQERGTILSKKKIYP